MTRKWSVLEVNQKKQTAERYVLMGGIGNTYARRFLSRSCRECWWHGILLPLQLGRKKGRKGERNVSRPVEGQPAPKEKVTRSRLPRDDCACRTASTYRGSTREEGAGTRRGGSVGITSSRAVARSVVDMSMGRASPDSCSCYPHTSYKGRDVGRPTALYTCRTALGRQGQLLDGGCLDQAQSPACPRHGQHVPVLLHTALAWYGN
ncbi:hypothetical protein F4861DRAFT_39253 [Xylaria intraflava]|nr:hypothetical protein F4861DRAFT_39253 [Xylaria intraflava]